MEKINNSTWKTEVKDVGDGSGDAFVELPQELLENLGWKEGDKINYEKSENGNIVLTKPK